jgi:hypothetical protein
MSTAIMQLYPILIHKFQWAPLLGQHVVHETEQSIGEKKEGFGYLTQLNMEEPSPDKCGGAACVVKDRKGICKYNCIGSSKGFVGCSWLEIKWLND